MPIVNSGSFDTEFFGLTVDAFTTRSLVINGLIDGTLTVKSHTHLSPFFPVNILDTAFAFDKLLVFTGSPRFLREKQRATEALGTIPIGVVELKSGMHTQAHRTERNPIGITL